MARDIAYQTQPSQAVPQAVKKLFATILVVDDDPMLVDLLCEYLKGNEYEVLTAHSGEDAISKIKLAQCDIALVDLQMPGMDGLETIEKMTEIDPEAVTILMTGFPTLDSSVQAIRLGASDYIMKPFKLEEVNFAVARAVKEHELRREVKNLKKRITDLEKGITDKKGNIKFNQKVNIVNTREGYSTRIVPSQEPEKKN